MRCWVRIASWLAPACLLVFGLESQQLQRPESDLREFAEYASSSFVQFEFGKNWLRFLRDVLSDPPLSNVSLLQRVQSVVTHLKHDFGLTSFEGKTFLDVGCGSGIASLAAIMLGASRVVSIDFQETSVEATQKLQAYAMANEHIFNIAHGRTWDILQGSILDDKFVASLEPADLVYSYGVLMHTGNSAQAMQNLARLVEIDSGLMLFYVHARETMADSEREQWLAFKQEYNAMQPWEQEESVFAWAISNLGDRINDCLATTGQSAEQNAYEPSFNNFNNIRGCMRTYFEKFATKSRGMDFITDNYDWLGGWPYEWLATDQTIRFLQHEVQPAMKTLRVILYGLTGFLLTPELTGKSNYLLNGLTVGQWSGFSLVELDAVEFTPWQEAVQLFNSFERDGLVSGTSLNIWRSVIQSAGAGGSCFMYVLPMEFWEKCGNEGENCVAPQSVLLEDMNIMGFGDISADGRFCHPGSGSRYHVWPSMLVVSTADGSNPSHNGHRYHLLKWEDSIN